ncbi:type IV pilus secretin PilQ [Inmirania thermothiophila]|uniref:Type IV pilus assembly protein PilQ n=1 Tax=Inmirania thermothiophila TaxID=1750597 RepID=A0A3N1Y6F1_9GAMM|nr:type IV pilus secretin PilQ [Inmirania thermothiophila]ROR34121.1 type IV pilus assembly protein PilQ [Inmirania thermothiophila]
MRGWGSGLAAALLLLGVLTGVRAAAAAEAVLEDVRFAALPGDRVQLALQFRGEAPEPVSFTTENPARIVLDFPDTRLGMERRSLPVGVGLVQAVHAVEAMGRTRVVVDLAAMVPYETRREADGLRLLLQGRPGPAVAAAAPAPEGAGGEPPRRIEDIDFRRGEEGEGRVLVRLSDPATVVDMRTEGGQVVLEFPDTGLPEALERRLDVVDFATPVRTIDTFRRDGRVVMVITPMAEFEHFAYQTDDLLTIEFKPLTRAEVEARKQEKFGYTGERLSLNFQDIEARAALQIIADFTGLNLVASDSVQGSLTLRLKNVPWDQALDIILKTKGLAMRKAGNVILVAPAEELAEQERKQLEARKQIAELEPLRSEFIQINYAKAAEIAALLKSEGNSLLSERGSVTVDERTNTLLVQDTATKLAEIRRVVAQLDIPVRQVLIESRVVIANNDFARDLGVRFGVTASDDRGGGDIAVLSGSSNATDTVIQSGVSNFNTTGSATPFDVPSLSDRFLVSLPAVNPAGRLALAILGSDVLLDLELSALQAEGRGEVISSPRVITSDQHEALIEQGVEIPFQEATSSGATAVSFKKAVLSLKVTPHITPDKRILMDLTVNKDSPDFSRSVLGVPPVDTREISTRVLVDNGDTVVLGGVYEQTRTHNTRKVPLLGDMPVLGWLFRQKSLQDNKNELLIFVTPKVLREQAVR